MRFAESSGTDLSAWLNANDATVETPLYAGDVLCIPEGASAPAAASDDGAADDEAPAPTDAPKRPSDARPHRPADPTRRRPPTPPETPAPTTTAAPDHDRPAGDDARPPGSPGGVEAIIRDVWPDELEERALVIAQRESSLRPDAYNGWCCYGLFQIYFDANRSFLASLGRDDARAAAGCPHERERWRTRCTSASGWAPWATTISAD